MSSTRHARSGSPFRQERWASSPASVPGLKANLVALRCKALSNPEDRQLIWALQKLSHEPGGLDAVAKALLRDYSDRVGTPPLRKLARRKGQICTPAQCQEIDASIYLSRWRQYTPISQCALQPDEEARQAEIDEFLSVISRQDRLREEEEIDQALRDAMTGGPRPPAPALESVDAFFNKCLEVARDSLPVHLAQLCLDPAITDLSRWPHYWADLGSTLREYLAARVETMQRGAVVTSIGQKIGEVLDYTQEERVLTLIEGNARIGKSHAARAWCEAHPGSARYIEVPPGSDAKVFFQAFAHGLKLGEFTNYKANEIRVRVESVLLSRNLVLVLDECHNLWPPTRFRPSLPFRIQWVMSMANHGVPICCTGTPQFTTFQRFVEERSGWDSSQWTGRIAHYEPLPATLEKSDLAKVARAFLPAADADSIKAMVVYACGSARYLAALEIIARRARNLARRANRSGPSATDVRRAMSESVIPSDRRLKEALQKPAAGSRRGKRLAPMPSPLADLAEDDRDAEALQSVGGASAALPQNLRPAAIADDFRGIDPALTGRGTRPVKADPEAEVIAD